MIARFKELVKQYGKVALGVHFSVSGIYVAINNNVDVESMLHRIGVPTGVKTPENEEKKNRSRDQGGDDDAQFAEKGTDYASCRQVLEEEE